jgi:hypothetical protein
LAKVTGTDPFAKETATLTETIIKGPQKRRRDLPHRMTYYLPAELCDRLREIAQEIEVPVSDVAHYALQDFARRYKNGELDLAPKVWMTRKKLV